jgi:hypothetical protein
LVTTRAFVEHARSPVRGSATAVNDMSVIGYMSYCK